MFEATQVVEFGLNYYGYMTEVLCAFAITTQIYRMVDILELIENCEEFIEKSKSIRICDDCAWMGFDSSFAREPCNDQVH